MADDFSQTVIAATGDHEVGDSAQTITSDPELLCQTADADAVTCRREHIASDGSGGGWIWNNLPCEPGIDMENQREPLPSGLHSSQDGSDTSIVADRLGLDAGGH